MSNELAVGEQRLSKLLETDGIKKRFQEMLGQKAPGFLSSIISAAKMNKKLAEAEPMSVISAAAVAAALDLPINPSLGFAHIVPYGGVAQFQMGWKGFVQLAMRSGQYKTMNAVEVYDGELVKEDRFTGAYEFDSSKKKSDEIIGYLFFFELVNGYSKQVYWPKEKVQAHAERYSQAYKYDLKDKKKESFWSKDFDAQALKTVVKNGLSKWGILSVEMQNAIEKDGGVIDAESGAVETYGDAPVMDAEVVTPSKSRLHKAIEAQAEPTEDEKGKKAKLEKQGIELSINDFEDKDELTKWFRALKQELQDDEHLKECFNKKWSALKAK